MPLNHRSLTIKQAKRAYRKSGATVRLTASELAQAERRAVCQQRADRIREREARRKANLKKRDEKIATEREIARRTGKPFLDERKGKWIVGASQLDLGRFLDGAQKPDKEKEEQKSDNDSGGEDKENQEPAVRRTEDTPAAVLNLLRPPTSPSGKPVVRNFACPDLEQRSPAIRPNFLQTMDDVLADCFASNTQIERELSRTPPEHAFVPDILPLAGSAKALASTPVNFSEANAVDLLAGISTQDLDFSGALTQAPVLASKRDEEEPFTQISTQDLEFQEESDVTAPAEESYRLDVMLGQISTQDLDFSDASQPENDKIYETGFSDDITDHDLEGLMKELDSSAEGTTKEKEQGQVKQESDMGQNAT